MGIVARVNQFTGSTAPQLTWLDTELDNLRAEFNGNIDDANIKTNAGIAQSKTANLTTDLAARVVKTGDRMTGRLDIRMDTPYVRLIGTEASAKDWRLDESAGLVLLQENTGTEGTPIWTTRYQFRTPNTPTADDDVATKKYVNDQVAAAGSSLAFPKVVKSDGDVTVTSTTFVDVTGLTATITTGAHRVRVTFIGAFRVGGPTDRTMSINVQVDATDVAGTDGVSGGTSTDANILHNLSFTFVTDPLTAASHTIKIQAKTSGGSPVLRADTARNAIFIVEELPL